MPTCAAPRARRFGSDTGDLVTLYQMGLPMDGGWRVNNALGVTNAPAVDLARQQQRFWVPSILHNGLATEWRSPGGLQLQASVGRPGLLTGLYVPTFESLGGEQVGAGAQWNRQQRLVRRAAGRDTSMTCNLDSAH